MKKLVFFILIIPLILSSWTGTWDRGYVVEEKIDTIPLYIASNFYVSWVGQGTVTDNYSFAGAAFNNTGHRAIFPLVFTKLFVKGAEKVHIDSIRFYYYVADTIDDADTFYIRIDTLRYTALSQNFYKYKSQRLPNTTSLHSTPFVTFYDFDIVEPLRYHVIWWLKKKGATGFGISLKPAIAFYKAYYKVR